MNKNNKQKLKKVKGNFISIDFTNWEIVLLWVIFFEVIASIIEFLYVDKSDVYSVNIPHTPFTEIIVAIFVTVFVWFCIYNIIFENRKNLFILAFFTMVGLYFIVTSDFTLQFLLQNLNPLHFFDLEFGVIFFIELFFKLVILYLLYQLIINYKNRLKE